jgi:hypothetical protein
VLSQADACAGLPRTESARSVREIEGQVFSGQISGQMLWYFMTINGRIGA